MAFSPDGRSALTGSADKTARLWDAATGLPRGPALRHDGAVLAVAFSPDGRSALTGSDDNTARLWFLPEKVHEAPDRLRLWVEVITGLAMNEWGDMRLLKPDEWKQRRDQLAAQGGAPVIRFPGKPSGTTPAR